MKASLPLGQQMKLAASELKARGIGTAQGWFMDDGQLFCSPEHADAVAKRVDDGFSAIGLGGEIVAWERP